MAGDEDNELGVNSVKVRDKDGNVTAIKYTAAFMGKNGKVRSVGNYASREDANAAYKQAHAKEYPPGPPTKVDPAKHTMLSAAEPPKPSRPSRDSGMH